MKQSCESREEAFVWISEEEACMDWAWGLVKRQGDCGKGKFAWCLGVGMPFLTLFALTFLGRKSARSVPVIDLF